MVISSETMSDPSETSEATNDQASASEVLTIEELSRQYDLAQEKLGLQRPLLTNALFEQHVDGEMQKNGSLKRKIQELSEQYELAQNDLRDKRQRLADALLEQHWNAKFRDKQTEASLDEQTAVDSDRENDWNDRGWTDDVVDEDEDEDDENRSEDSGSDCDTLTRFLNDGACVVFSISDHLDNDNIANAETHEDDEEEGADTEDHDEASDNEVVDVDLDEGGIEQLRQDRVSTLSVDLVIPQPKFEALVGEITLNLASKQIATFESNAIEALQEAAEQYMIQMFKAAQMVANASDANGITVDHLQAVLKVRAVWGTQDSNGGVIESC
ncbi:hypothetical protein BDV96DRAFT_596014 [Lophiotrema nucula]|uniref:Core Histone H2A/H2B/H3 domain-containing protein n=1 Tax=Lophiotrema nucula TaxID=690887 RepID=A0A6A5ZI54_9PLEO|nr:hypothetical protein BDV96DRAFT_596014 [Lophiotrema nucula]